MTYDDWKTTEPDPWAMPLERDELDGVEPEPRDDAEHSHRIVTSLGEAQVAYYAAHAAYMDRHQGAEYIASRPDRHQGAEYIASRPDWDATVQPLLDKYLDADREMREWAKMVAKGGVT